MVEEAKQDKRGFPIRRAYFIGMILTLSSASLWGSTYPVIKIDLLYNNPFQISFFRALFGSVTMFVFLVVSKKRFWFLPRNPKTLALLIFASFLGATGFWTLLNLGVLFVEADVSAFLVALYPLISIVFASLFLGERLTTPKAFGVFLGIVGTFIIISFGEGASLTGANPLMGEIFSLLAAFSWAGYMIVTKQLMGRIDKKTGRLLDPEYVTFTTFLLALIPTLIIAALSLPVSDLFQTGTTGLIVNLYLGVIASAIAFLIFNIGLKFIGVSRAAVNQLLFPVVAVLASYVLLGETIDLSEVVGIALIVVGILAAQVFSK